MTAKKPGVRVSHQVWWEDMLPWVEQLYEEFGLLTSFGISCPPSVSGIRWAVVLECVRPAGKSPGVVAVRDWQVFNPHNTGACEAAALMLVSRALLSLSNERDERAAQQGELFGK